MSVPTYTDQERIRASHTKSRRLAVLQAQVAAEPSPEAAAFEAIQRLTRYQARVVVNCFYYLGRTPLDPETMSVFRREDPEDALAAEIPLPYRVEVRDYGVEALGATLAEALQTAVAELQQVMAE